MTQDPSEREMQREKRKRGSVRWRYMKREWWGEEGTLLRMIGDGSDTDTKLVPQWLVRPTGR